jgi:MYXO-CTERM domain-containing protein
MHRFAAARSEPEVDAGPVASMAAIATAAHDPPDASIGPRQAGCGCRATPSSSRLPWALVAIAIVLFVRRRR